MGSEPPGEVRDRLHDALLSRIGWGGVRVRERLVVGVRGGVCLSVVIGKKKVPSPRGVIVH